MRKAFVNYSRSLLITNKLWCRSLSSTASTDTVVVGAGVVGLATARALALAGREVVVLEAGDHIGAGISSRNSEVIHAGIYYPAGSLKARLCVEGKLRLYEYCKRHGVEYKRVGKLIVATSEAELPKLKELKARAELNGVHNLNLLDSKGVNNVEPAVRAEGGLFSPSTGIVDSHGLMMALRADSEANGAVFAFNSKVVSGEIQGEDKVLSVADVSSGMVSQLSCRVLVNASGLHAQHIAGSLNGFPQDKVPQLYLAKGNYFTITGKTPFSRLVYPLPEGGGLGVHLTLDLAGQAKLGPDVEWVTDINYDVEPTRGDSFYAAVRRYWPQLPDDCLQPSYSGVRPKLSGPGQPAADFMIQGPKDHGISGIINMFGIESPGLTSCLAIAKHVKTLLGDWQ